MGSKYKIYKYSGSDKMSNLICDNHLTLIIINRFGINMGFKESTVEQVCSDYNIDLATFLAITNLVISGGMASADTTQLSLKTLVDYLYKSHTYYLEYKFPVIREMLCSAINQDNPISSAIITYYDEYIAEVRKHMAYENEHVFNYVEKLLSGHDTTQLNSDNFSGLHDNRDLKLAELKNIIIKYCPATSSNELSTVLHEIFVCEELLALHRKIEDTLLVPTINKFEQEKLNHNEK